MKTYTIDITDELRNITISVPNGSDFEYYAIRGKYKVFRISVSNNDYKRIATYCLKHCNYYHSGRSWYAQCSCFAMELTIHKDAWSKNKYVTINTYRGYGMNCVYSRVGANRKWIKYGKDESK